MTRAVPPTAVLIAVFLALATSLAEIAILGFRTVVLGQTLFLSEQIIWMVPLSYVVVFLPVGVALSVVERGRAEPAQLSPFAGWVLAMGSFSNLLLQFHPRISKAAIVLLAAGLSVQAGRLVSRHGPRLRNLAQRSVPIAAGALALCGFGVNLVPFVRERAAAGRLPSAPDGAPNVLLVILDTVRAWSTGLDGGGPPTTPGLDRVGREGLIFERAYAPSSWTTPSHASLFTGRWPHELSDDWLPLRPMAANQPTLASVLAANGYVTAGFVANSEYAGSTAGLDRGFQHFEDYGISWGELAISSVPGQVLVNSPRLRRLTGWYDIPGRKTAADVNRDVLAWLDRQPGRPFFAFVNYYDAHEPYLPPEPYASRFDRGGLQNKSLISNWRARQAKRLDKRLMSEVEVQGELDAYEGAIAYMDAQLDTLLRALDRRGLLDNTVVIVTSDHGEQFGEHGMFDHGNSLYLATLHVPLVIRYPGRVPRGARVADPVSIRDLAATITEIVGTGDGASLPGRSLTRAWIAGSGTPQPVFARVARKPRTESFYPVARGDLESVIDKDWQYIRNSDGTEELFDLAADPRGGTNPANTERGREALDRLRGEFARAVAGRGAEGTER